jgi:transcriptional regulator with XRE-family HTH domain
VTSLKNLAYYRKLSGLKQSDVAEYLGLNQSTVSKLERNVNDCPLSVALKISELLKVDLFRLAQYERGERDEKG